MRWNMFAIQIHFFSKCICMIQYKHSSVYQHSSDVHGSGICGYLEPVYQERCYLYCIINKQRPFNANNSQMTSKQHGVAMLTNKLKNVVVESTHWYHYYRQKITVPVIDDAMVILEIESGIVGL